MERVARYIGALLCLMMAIVLLQVFREHDAPVEVSDKAQLPGQPALNPNSDLTSAPARSSEAHVAVENGLTRPRPTTSPEEKVSPASDIPPRKTVSLPAEENLVAAPRPPIPEAEENLPAPSRVRPLIQEALRSKVLTFKLATPVSRREVLREIGELSGLRIEVFAKKHSLELNTKIIFEVHETTVRELLAEALKASHLIYVEREDVLIIEDAPTE